MIDHLNGSLKSIHPIFKHGSRVNTSLTIFFKRTIQLDFQNKVALITGASRGIGRATAKLLAQRGAHLILISRDNKLLHQLMSEIQRHYKVDILLKEIDVRHQAELCEAVIESFNYYGKIDIAICNAGIGQYGPVAQTKWNDIQNVIDTNIEGAIATTHLILPFMIKQKSGSIILVSSVLGKRASPYNAVYCASKYALHGFADALRLEVKHFGVHIGVVCPARTNTDFFVNMIYSVPQKQQRKVPVASAEKVARSIIKAIEKKKREVVVSLGGIAFTFMGVHFPRTFDFILDKAVPKPDSK